MKNLILTILILSLPAMMLGQTFGEIQGKVVDTTGTPLEDIEVFVVIGANLVGTTTDDRGKYTLKPLNPGTYNVTFSSVPHVQVIYEDVKVTPDQISFIPEVKMRENIYTTGEAIIFGYKRPLIEKETGKVSILAAEFEHNTAAKTPIKLIASMSSEISEGEGGQLYFRGSRAGSVQYFVDGVKLRGSISNRFPSSAIGSISIYTGGVPAKYGDVTGGVIVIETKNYFDLYNAAKNANQ